MKVIFTSTVSHTELYEPLNGGHCYPLKPQRFDHWRENAHILQSSLTERHSPVSLLINSTIATCSVWQRLPPGPAGLPRMLIGEASSIGDPHHRVISEDELPLRRIREGQVSVEAENSKDILRYLSRSSLK